MAYKTNLPAYFLVLLTSIAWTFPAAGVSSAAPGPTDPAEVAAFMDGFWQKEMQPLGIPGAVFVLVKGDQIVFSKGYGLSDVAQERPVDPAETLFAIGSVSKAVTATAVMQLVERGQLRLEEPVDSYLKSFQIGKSCSRPVTTADLLTQTAGFDERVMGGFVLSPEQRTPLVEYEARDLPPCIRPPGQEMSYCNHCYGLAGLLVQEIAGLPFEQYVKENIFAPLEMLHSSFYQPLETGLEGLRATGYIFTPEIQPAPRVYINGFPSGGMWASGEDMGRFIIGQLRGGLAGKGQVLNEETRSQMHRVQFSQDPRLEGWTYGFFELFENSERLLEKGGDVPGFSSALYLMPEHDLGLFLSYNATAGTGAVDPRLVFPSYFLDHYFPDRETPLEAKSTGIASQLAGAYRWARYGHTSIDKAISPMALLQWQVSANPNSTLTLAYPTLLGGQTSRWIEVEPGLFRNPGNGAYLAYALDSRGQATHIYTKMGEEGVLERVAWYETLAFQASLLVLMSAIFLSALAVSIAVLVRRRRTAWRDHGPGATTQPTSGRVMRLAPWLAGSLAALNLIFLAGLVMVISQSMTTRAPLVSAYFIGLLVIPLVTGVLALILLGMTLLAWKGRTGSILGRACLTLVSLAGLAFTWFTWYWNLLGFKL